MPLPDDSAEESVYDQVSKSRFTPYDPEAVQPTSDRPAPSSSDAPGFGDTSGADGEAGGEPQAQDQAEPPPEFDPRWREPFEGLLYLGSLTDTFTLWDHEFVVRTLTTEEMAEIALLVKPYEGTLARNAVYQAAVCAASVLSVDGRPLPQSIVVGDNSLASTKFPYVLKKWLPPVRERVYQKCFDLEVTVREVLDQMGKASG